MAEPLAYVSGEWLPHDQARISIFDSAVMLGDCVTESTRTFARVPGPLRSGSSGAISAKRWYSSPTRMIVGSPTW